MTIHWKPALFIPRTKYNTRIVWPAKLLVVVVVIVHMPIAHLHFVDGRNFAFGKTENACEMNSIRFLLFHVFWCRLRLIAKTNHRRFVFFPFELSNDTECHCLLSLLIYGILFRGFVQLDMDEVETIRNYYSIQLWIRSRNAFDSPIPIQSTLQPNTPTHRQFPWKKNVKLQKAAKRNQRQKCVTVVPLFMIELPVVELSSRYYEQSKICRRIDERKKNWWQIFDLSYDLFDRCNALCSYSQFVGGKCQCSRLFRTLHIREILKKCRTISDQAKTMHNRLNLSLANKLT